jgi:xanthine dehydrogenase YagS FAD-binding subunit
MQPFNYVHADDETRAIAAGATRGAQFIAGGTNVVDLLRLEVIRPDSIIDITALPLREVSVVGKAVKIGALVRNSDLAYHPVIVERFPVLAEALLAGASPQVRNMATVAGNLLQRTRCAYFRDGVSPCNKRAPGTGCAAREGYTRMHAILGISEHCIAAYPSDMTTALVALDAIVHTHGPNGTRAFPVTELHTLPGAHPEIETVLQPGELITHVELPATAFAARSRYVKVRDRASFAFALASAAVALELRDATIRDARIALGGVATKPWRARDAERMLVGKAPSTVAFRDAADAALVGATPIADNAFKVELAKRTLVRALQRAGAP